MNIRSSVRRRRRRKIKQLLSGMPALGREGIHRPDSTGTGGDRAYMSGSSGADWNRAGAGRDWGRQQAEPVTAPVSPDRDQTDLSGSTPAGRRWPNWSGKQQAQPASSGEPLHWGTADNFNEPDPEKWWKEQQKISPKRVFAGSGQRAGLTTDRQIYYRYETGGRWSRFMTGFALRLIIAAAIFSASWIWFRSDLPGSREARAWTAQAVTQDMDFRAVQAWYEQSFGGSPSFLPMFRSQDEAQEVFGGWKRSDAVLPVQGRVVQSYEQEGSGVRIAAPGDSRVKAVYGGRVTQVEMDEGGKATVLIQHAGQIVTIYGNLQYPEVRTGDWVEAGDVLGSVPPPQDADGESLLYFAVRQNGRTVNPAEVVPFD